MTEQTEATEFSEWVKRELDPNVAPLKAAFMFEAWQAARQSLVDEAVKLLERTKLPYDDMPPPREIGVNTGISKAIAILKELS